MGKFGKRVNVNTELNNYMIGVMAPSGFGKSTLMYQVCEKEFGPDGYIILDMGTENGTAALQGAVAEQIPTWKKMKEVVDDIVKNKETDYADLKVVILDTLDAAFDAAEEFCVKTWNSSNVGKQGFVPATSINSVEGGYGKGLDKVIETVKKEITRLNNVGVGVFWTAHVKEKDQSDLFTGANYTTLTANMTNKYFNSIKNSSHIVAFGYFDRSIEKQEVGDANPITKKKKERKAVIDETRKLKFRDDALIADAKSRFSNITDEIVLDSDEFIKAIKDAIEAERTKVAYKTSTKKSITKSKPNTPVAEEPDEEDVELLKAKESDEPPFDLDDDEEVIEETVDVDIPTLMTEIRVAFKSADADTKRAVKEILSANGTTKLSEDLGAKVLLEIKTALE